MGSKFYQKHKIVVTGFPYAFPYYWKVFEYLENKDNFVFVLPKFWWAKDGKIQIKLEKKQGFIIYGLKAMSYGGKSLYGGLFKGWMPGLALKLPHLRLKYGSKVLYSCSEPHLLTTLYNGIFAKLFGYKHVLFTWQNIPPQERMRGLKLQLSNCLVKINLALADGIICGNKKAEVVVKNLNPHIKTIVCPISGVDVDKFHPSLRESSWGGEKKVLFYGALDNRKGVDVLIKAFDKIKNKLPCHLTIVGTGPKKDALIALANKLNIDNITFLDWMKNDELPRLLASSDVFVYPSVPTGGWEEQFGYAMAEASACSIPIIATRTGSIEEVVIDEKSGVLVEPNSPEELTEALEKVLLNEDLSLRMGKFGRQYIVNKFSNEVIAGKIENFLNGYTS